MKTTSISTAGLLLVAFIVLKLTGTIHWPWLWVLAPAWGPLPLALAIVTVVGLAVLIAACPTNELH